MSYLTLITCTQEDIEYNKTMEYLEKTIFVYSWSSYTPYTPNQKLKRERKGNFI